MEIWKRKGTWHCGVLKSQNRID